MAKLANFKFFCTENTSRSQKLIFWSWEVTLMFWNFFGANPRQQCVLCNNTISIFHYTFLTQKWLIVAHGQYLILYSFFNFGVVVVSLCKIWWQLDNNDITRLAVYTIQGMKPETCSAIIGYHKAYYFSEWIICPAVFADILDLKSKCRTAITSEKCTVSSLRCSGVKFWKYFILLSFQSWNFVLKVRQILASIKNNSPLYNTLKATIIKQQTIFSTYLKAVHCNQTNLRWYRSYVYSHLCFLSS